MPLVVDQRLEDLVNHREMAIVVLELTLEIDQVSRQTVQSLGKELRELVGDLLVRLEESTATFDNMSTARCGGANRRYGRNVEQK